MSAQTGDRMLHLVEVTEENWMQIASLSVSEEQKTFLAPAIGILARGYVYRSCNARVLGIAVNEQIVGVALVRDFTEEPVGYDLQQFMIDAHFQGKGYGTKALQLILELLQEEGRYSTVEVCVKKAAVAALRVYEKVGFVDSGYVDEDLPDCVNLVYTLPLKLG